MPYLSNRNDLFKVELPKVFIPDEVKNEFKDYVYKLPLQINDISDLINYSIQSISIPNINYNPVEQTRPGFDFNSRGTSRLYRNTANIEQLFDRNLEITFQLLGGNINYWILLKTFLYYYNYKNKNPYIFDIVVHLYDDEGLLMYSVKFKDCLYTGLSQFDLSYSDLDVEFKTFDMSIEFNDIELYFSTQ